MKELREGVAGGITVEGFLRLMQLFIEKKQVRGDGLARGGDVKGGKERLGRLSRPSAEEIVSINENRD